MARDILAGAPASTPAGTAGAQDQPAAAAPAQAQAPAHEPRDALAGTLPAWDLLPASPFVRRVK